MIFGGSQARLPLVGLVVAAAVGIVAADRCEINIWVILPWYTVAAVWLAFRPAQLGIWLFVVASFFVLHMLGPQRGAARDLARGIAPEGHVARVTGIVLAEPEPSPTVSRAGPRSRFPLRLELFELAGQTRPSSSTIMVRWTGPEPIYGDRVMIGGDLQNIAPPRNPGEFDYAGHLRRKGIYSELQARYAADCQVLSSNHGNPAFALALRAKRWMQQTLRADLEDAPEIAALIQSMVLGVKGETSDEVQELFQRTGTLHLFAVSGLNIAMLAGIAWAIFKSMRFSRTAAVFAIIPILCFYALVTGLSASSVRATVMGALVLAAYLFDRQPLTFNNVAAAALAILTWDTNQLFAPGFQFSFVLVVVIVSAGMRLQRRLERFGAPDSFLPRELWSAFQVRCFKWWKMVATGVAVSLAAWAGSILLTAGYFHLFSLSAIAANLIAVPLAFLVLALGVAALMVAAFSTVLLETINNANWLVAKVILLVVDLFARVPGGHVYVETPRFSRAPGCEVTVLDVGAGGAAHLRTPQVDWLADCGSAADYRRIVSPYLRSRGVNRLDGLWLSHGDSLHIGGALAVIDDFAPRQICEAPVRDRSPTRRTLHHALMQRDRGRALWFSGDEIPCGEAMTLRVLYPPLGISRPLADDKALVVQLRYDSVRLLFVSDGGFLTEQWLMDNVATLKSDVLIKGAHGSDLSGTPGFITAVGPSVIICTGASFPDQANVPESWAAEIAGRGVILFRQDQTGAVIVELDADEVLVRAFLGNQRFRTRARYIGSP